jgi:hypothetical protein
MTIETDHADGQLTPPMTWGERVADKLVMGVILFWFVFLGATPQRIRASEASPMPTGKGAAQNDNEPRDVPRLAAE